MTHPSPGEWALPEAPAAPPPAVPPVVPRPGAITLDEARRLRARARASSAIAIRLRPLRLVDVFDSAFAVIKAQPREVTLLVLPLVLPTSLLQAYLGRQSPAASIVDFFGSPGRFGRAAAGDAWLYLLYVVDLAVVAVAGVLLAVMIARSLGDEIPTAGSVTRQAAPLLPQVVAGFVIVHAIELVAVAGFVIGTYFVLPMLCVVSPVIAFERVGPIAATRRSWTLARRRYSQALGFVTFSALVVFLLGLLFGWLPATIANALGDRWYGWVIVGVAGVMLTTVTTAFVALSATFFYLNLRVRNEGIDIDLQARELLAGA